MVRFCMRYKFLIAALLIAIMVWPIDAILDTLRYRVAGFWDELFHTSDREIFDRGLFACLILAFGAYVHWTMRRLYESEERFQLAMQGINGGVWDWIPQTGVIDCSPPLIETLLGYDANTGNLLKKWMDLIHPDERQDVAQALREMADGRLGRYEGAMRMRHHDGHWIHIRFRAFPTLLDHLDKPARIIGTVADITEHKRVENGYFLNSELLKVMLGTTTDGYWLCDKNARIIDTNAAYSDMTGFPRERIVNHTITDFEVVETPEETAEHIQKVLATGFDRFESKHRCKDGSIIDVEVSVSYMQNQQMFISFFRDITMRNKYKEELLRLSRVVEQTSEGVMIVNREGIIEYVNPAFCRNTGYSEEEAIGRKPSILKSGAQDDAFYTHMWSAITQGESWSGSVVDQRKDGSFFPALLSIFPIHDEAGKNIYFVGIQQDISELKRLEDQFLQAQKMEAVGTLVGGIAHDFNNMLAAIEANVFLIRHKVGKAPEDAIARMTDIETLTTRGANMIKQLLAFARKDTPRLSSMSLCSFLKESLKLAKTGIPENIEFVNDICIDGTCAEELFIRGDPTQLQQVIMNLLNNARDALAGVPQPRIECTLAPFEPTENFSKKHPNISASRLARLTIRDNGPGISKDHQNKIFEPFFTTKTVGKGTGLGLAMVYGAIETHGGVIELVSDEGKGAAFHIYLPLTDEPPESGMGTEPAAISEGRGETVLLVDDEQSVRHTTGVMLGKLGYRVLMAADGLEAVAKIKDHQGTIDLIISDVVMPRMGGMDLAKTIRGSGDDTPIIFITGYDREGSVGADHRIAHSVVINKPFSPQQLSQTIRRMLEADRSRQT